MPIGDCWGTWEGACPWCGGDISYWAFGADCRGNPPSGGVQCKAPNCGFVMDRCFQDAKHMAEHVAKEGPQKAQTRYDHILNNEDNDE